MKIKLLTIFLSSILFINTGFAQSSSPPNNQNKLEFSTGFNFGSLKNLQFAPVSRYDYKGLVYNLGYSRISRNQNLFEVRLDYLETELKTDVIPVLNLDYAKIGLNISYLKKTYAENNVSIHLGLHSQSIVSIYSKGDNNRLITDQSFGIGSRFSYQINEKQQLSSKLIVPLVLFRITDNYANIYSLNRNQSLLWNMNYEYSLSDQFDLRFDYDFNYNRLQIPNAFRELQHQLKFGFNFKF